jgi:hypothetical protein
MAAAESSTGSMRDCRTSETSGGCQAINGWCGEDLLQVLTAGIAWMTLGSIDAI